MKKIILSLIFILLISFSSAMNIQKSKITDVIVPEFTNQRAHFELTITNANYGTYNIYTLTDVRLMPTTPFGLSSGTNYLDVYVYPAEQLKERGFYTFTYNLKKQDGETTEDKLTVKIVELKDLVEISSDPIAPDTEKKVFYIRNKENAELKDIRARFSSILFETEKTFDLEPYQKLEIEFDANKEKLKKTPAGSYIINAQFETDKGPINIEGKLYLGEKKGIETQEDSSGLLIHTKTITKINIGNVPQQVNIKISKDIFSRLFTTFNIEPDRVDREGFVVAYSWTKELKPSEIHALKIKTNYIFPLLIIIFGALAVIGFKRYSEAKLEVRKSASHVKTKGGEFALRVSLSLRARKNIENVSLIDRIPAVVKVYEKFGTSKPDKIDAANRRLRWNIGDLSAGEERLFNYVIYSKVGIFGKFSLPEALAVFERNGEIHEAESNKVFFLSEQTRKDDYAK